MKLYYFASFKTSKDKRNIFPSLALSRNNRKIFASHAKDRLYNKSIQESGKGRIVLPNRAAKNIDKKTGPFMTNRPLQKIIKNNFLNFHPNALEALQELARIHEH